MGPDSREPVRFPQPAKSVCGECCEALPFSPELYLTRPGLRRSCTSPECGAKAEVTRRREFPYCSQAAGSIAVESISRGERKRFFDSTALAVSGHQLTVASGVVAAGKWPGKISVSELRPCGRGHAGPSVWEDDAEHASRGQTQTSIGERSPLQPEEGRLEENFPEVEIQPIIRPLRDRRCLWRRVSLAAFLEPDAGDFWWWAGWPPSPRQSPADSVRHK